MDNRKNREVEVREETDVREKKTWKPAALLPEIKQEKGYAYRWVRVSLANEADNLNASSRMREGWEPRPADTVKSKLYPTINHGQWAGSIGIEGMLLCEMPEEKHEQMRHYYSGKNDELNESIAGDLDALGRRSGQTIYQDRKSETSRGRSLSAASD